MHPKNRRREAKAHAKDTERSLAEIQPLVWALSQSVSKQAVENFMSHPILNLLFRIAVPYFVIAGHRTCENRSHRKNKPREQIDQMQVQLEYHEEIRKLLEIANYFRYKNYRPRES